MSCQQIRESAAVSLLAGADWDDAVAVHVQGCAACRVELAELRDTVGLLALAGPDVVPPAEPPDPALLGWLLAEAAERRHAHRVRTAFALAAAVVLVIALGVGVGAMVTHRSGPTSVPTAVATGSARDQVTGVSGSARVTSVAAGAEVAFSASGVPPGTVCTLRVVTRDGRSHAVLTWTADYTSTASVTGTTAVPAAAITRAELVDGRGRLLVPVEVT